MIVDLSALDPRHSYYNKYWLESYTIMGGWKGPKFAKYVWNWYGKYVYYDLTENCLKKHKWSI